MSRRGNKRIQPEEPPAEQLSRATFELGPVKTERGQVVGVAYQRLPWFETLYRRNQITSEQVRALRLYRGAFESSNRSEVKSGLDIQPRGGRGGDGPGFAMFAARGRVEQLERPLRALVSTMRAVALHDLTFSDVAMARYGSREVDYIVKGRTTTKLSVRSGTHRDIIAEEFQQGLEKLVEAAQPLLETGSK